MISQQPDSGIMNPPDEIIDFFKRYARYFILGHTEPDGDCLGSQLALKLHLESRGITARLFSPGPFSRPEIEELEPYFEKFWPEEAPAADTAVVIVDCSTADRVGDFRNGLADYPVCVIDHHASGSQFGDVRWIVPQAPSVTVMIQSLIESSGSEPSAEIAEQLFFGLATDTGFFRHLDSGSEATLHAAGRLIGTGISPKKTFARMYGNRPLVSRILLGRLLGRCRPLAGGKLLYTYESLADIEELGPDSRDSDQLYQLLLGTRGCEAAAVIREESPGVCSVGLRALYSLDVGSIAKEFDGGGHAKAAGFSFRGSREALEARLLPLLLSRLA